eukprot:6610001-Alexandrium_andersonii.AAC.1
MLLCAPLPLQATDQMCAGWGAAPESSSKPTFNIHNRRTPAGWQGQGHGSFSKRSCWQSST